MQYFFSEMGMILLMEKHPQVREAFKKEGFDSENLEFIKTLIDQRMFNYKATLALKKIYKEFVEGGTEEFQKEYSEITPMYANPIEPVDGQRFYSYKIDERNGEREYTHKGVIAIDADTNKDEWLDEFTGDYMSGAEKEEGEDYYWVDGEIILTPAGVEEITRDEFEVVKKYI